jgi:DNA-binding transcriptional LysR family regulator
MWSALDFSRRIKASHLRLVLKIAELGKLQGAAAAQGVSQPAASRILTEIETYAGAPLFYRHPKGMFATPVGEAFLRHARTIVNEMESLESEVRHLSRGDAGEVRVGAVTGPAVGCVVPAIRSVRERAPLIRATIEVGPSASLVRGLEEGRFHFVLSRLPAGHDSHAFHVMPARAESVSLMVRQGHPLLECQPVSLAEAASHEWVMQEAGSPIRQAVEGAFLAGSVEVPGNITNTSSLLVALAMLEQTDAIAPQSGEVADMLTSRAIGARLAILRTAEPMTVSPYYVVRNRNQQLPRAAELVLDEVLRRLAAG